MPERAGNTNAEFQWLLSLLAVGLCLRILAVTAFPQRLPDYEVYEAYAKTIYRGSDYRTGDDWCQRTPGYPFYLALCWWSVGGIGEAAPRWGQVAIGTLTIWLAFHLCVPLRNRHMLPPWSPIGAAGLVAFEPFTIAFTGLLLTETLSTLLLTAGLLTTLLAIAANSDAARIRWSAATGLLLGCLCLVRPSFYLLGWLGLGYALAASWRHPLSTRAVVTAGVCFLIVLGPWALRNAQVHQTLIPTALNGGASLYDGWNENATGASDTRFEQSPEIHGLPEVERDRLLARKAWAFAFSQPDRVVALAIVKWGRLWSPWPNADRFNQWPIAIATSLVNIPLLFFAGFGLGTLVCRRVFHRSVWITNTQLWLVVVGPVVYVTALHAVFVGSVRYRLPVVPSLAVLAMVGVDAALAASRGSTKASPFLGNP